jgi:hypothetical protein
MKCGEGWLIQWVMVFVMILTVMYLLLQVGRKWGRDEVMNRIGLHIEIGDASSSQRSVPDFSGGKP